MKTAFRFLFLALLAAPALRPLAAHAAPAVVSYTLVNADTDLDIQPLATGDVLDLAALPTRNLNIRATTSPATVGSVVFSLNGAQSHADTENLAPYALFSDISGDYLAWTPPLGSYALTATPYDGPDGTGPAGPPLTISFVVTSSVGAVVGYTLVDADTDQAIQALPAGAVLNLAALPTFNLNIRANTSPTTVGSVVFSLSGAQTHADTENFVPYALFSDIGGDYFAWAPPLGSYTVTATPYDGPNGTGPAGTPLTISFVVANAPLPVVLTAFAATLAGPGDVALTWATASETRCQEFVVERSPDGRQFAALGAVPGHGSTSSSHAYGYADHPRLAQAALLYYRLRQVDTDGTGTLSPVRALWVAGAGASFTVFPTLAAEGRVQYAFAGPTTGTETLEVLNPLGQRCGQAPLAAGGTGTLAVAGLPAGAYWLRLTSKQGRYSGRFVLP